MTPFEYSLGLISILMSLALADIVMSFHRLMRRFHSVKWDGRVLLAAGLVILEIIRMWFAQWTLRNLGVALEFPIYVALFGQILLLVLTAAACLPDEVGEGCDLHRFYESNRRYFWGAFAASQAAYFGLWLIIGGGQASVGGAVGAMDWFRMLAPLAAFVVLAIVRWKLLDYALPTLLVVFYAWRYWTQALVA